MKSKPLKQSELLTTPKACRIMGITRQTLYAWIQAGRLKPWLKVGGASWLFEKDEIYNVRDLKYRRFKKVRSYKKSK